MKRLLSLFLAACLALSLSGCLADYDTPKHAELSEQYDFYADSQSALSSGMAITPEQADEVFIVLVSCGMEAKVTNVTRKAGDDGHCQVSAGLYVYDVYYTDGVVDRVEYNGEELYPNPAPASVEPAPTDDPAAPETPATLEQAVDDAITAANAEKEDVSIYDAASVGESSDGSFVDIYLSGKDNLTPNMVRKGMLLQAADILESLQSRDDIGRVTLFWSFPLVDAYGNTSTETVMKATFYKDTISKINFDNFDYNNIPVICDDFYQHAALNG